MFVDTNVLVFARNAASPNRQVALAALTRGRQQDALRISRQVVREYLAVVTRPQAWASPLPMSKALTDASRLASAFEILEDGQTVADTLAAPCREVAVAGKQVRDANIVATMLAHGEQRLMTFNAKDFRRYGGRLELVALQMQRHGQTQDGRR